MFGSLKVWRQRWWSGWVGRYGTGCARWNGYLDCRRAPGVRSFRPGPDNASALVSRVSYAARGSGRALDVVMGRRQRVLRAVVPWSGAAGARSRKGKDGAG